MLSSSSVFVLFCFWKWTLMGKMFLQNFFKNWTSKITLKMWWGIWIQLFFKLLFLFQDSPIGVSMRTNYIAPCRTASTVALTFYCRRRPSISWVKSLIWTEEYEYEEEEKRKMYIHIKHKHEFTEFIIFTDEADALLLEGPVGWIFMEAHLTVCFVFRLLSAGLPCNLWCKMAVDQVQDHL